MNECLGFLSRNGFGRSQFNDTVSYQGRLVSPSSLILVLDWHCQSANS